MTIISRASLAFKTMRPALKPPYGSNVITALTPAIPQSKLVAAGPFSNLPVSLAVLQQFNNDLTAAIADALTGNYTAVASVKNAVAAWDEAFTLTANYISTVAGGDEMLIRTAGFVPTKSSRQTIQKPGAPTGFKVTINGSKGAIIAGTKSAVPEAKVYLFSALPDGAMVSYVANVMIVTMGKASFYITADTRKQTELYNLPSGVPFNVSMYAINAAGSGPAAAPQVIIPQ